MVGAFRRTAVPSRIRPAWARSNCVPAGTQLLRAQAGLIREGTAVRLNVPATATN